MVKSCPAGTAKKATKKCEEAPFEFVCSLDNVVYWNEACAACHGVTEFAAGECHGEVETCAEKFQGHIYERWCRSTNREPVCSRDARVTFRNSYCALCNSQRQYT